MWTRCGPAARGNAPAPLLTPPPQISTSIPLLRLLRPNARIIFYCHFPDQLLTRRESALKWIYRLPFDLAEEVTTGLADTILVNSRFTQRVFKDTFRLLGPLRTPGVLYPTIRVPPLASCASHRPSAPSHDPPRSSPSRPFASAGTPAARCR